MAQANNKNKTASGFRLGTERPHSGGVRSLKDALSEAGFGEVPPSRPGGTEGYDASRDLRETVSRGNIARSVDTAPALRNLLASLRPPSEPVHDAPLMRQVPASSVVSPPPWLRAKRRGRLEARVLNTFGWVMTLIVVGSLVGLAGRYLVVPPPGGVHIQARQ